MTFVDQIIFNDFLQNNSFLNSLVLSEFYMSDNNYIIKISINDILHVFFTDFKYYCYVENNDQLTNMFFDNNLYSDYKSFLLFIGNLSIVEQQKPIIEYKDLYNLHFSIPEKLKVNINYILLENESTKYTIIIYHIQSHQLIIIFIHY
jgi:hypothetical protein